jgi:hypothetical protein
MSQTDCRIGLATSQRGAPRGTTKVRAGLYRHSSGRYITKTEDLREGPRGGALGAWELASEDTFSGTGLVIDGSDFTTLRAAISYLERGR